MQLVCNVMRGEEIESQHLIYAVVVNKNSDIIFSTGDSNHITCIRSSLKPFQASTLIKYNGHIKFNLTDKELSLLCASHSAEKIHTDTILKILKKINCDHNDLECGTHPAYDLGTRDSMLKSGIACSSIHNNCSGKHVGMLALAKTLKINHKNEFKEFDGIWSSSLTDSASNGKPDNQSVELSTRINNLNNVIEVTSKPVLFDADNGGRPEHLPYTIKNLERLGVSAIAIEDKIGLKSNSLSKDQTKANQDSIGSFCKKIKIASTARRSNDFLIVARIESFILGRNLKDALKRAESYSRAGADLILIHSKNNTPKEIFSFSKAFKKSKYFKPLVAVPSTYSKVTESQLIKNGFKVVIYANHLLRAAYPAMENAALKILKNSRSLELEKDIISINKILNIIPVE